MSEKDLTFQEEYSGVEKLFRAAWASLIVVNKINGVGLSKDVRMLEGDFNVYLYKPLSQETFTSVD